MQHSLSSCSYSTRAAAQAAHLHRLVVQPLWHLFEQVLQQQVV
jgi:hypothetical protein